MKTVHLSAELIAGLDRPETLVTLVDDVYVGTVLSSGPIFSRYGHGDVWTPYTVTVDQQLLGELPDTITLIQHGGIDPVTNTKVVIEDVDPLLEVGETYLFASNKTVSRHLATPEQQNIVMPVYGHVHIPNEAQREQLVQKYTEAINQAGLGS